jgi:7-carboxy-7-deazaguanine synthase
MIINEIFYSLQGEGLLTGVPSVFVRLAGCPLRCAWCDTKYALDPNAGDDLSIEQIINKVDSVSRSSQVPLKKNIVNSAVSVCSAVKNGCRFVVITGGEPMINPQLPALVVTLKKQNKHITIETAGIKFVPDLPCDLMSISPKTSNSGQKTQTLAATQLISHYPYQLKFVVDSPDDLAEIQLAIAQIGNVVPEKVLLMPQAKTREELIAKSPLVADLCKHAGFTFSNRLHILLYNDRKGV